MNHSFRNDQEFLTRLTEIILVNLTNEQFGVSELAGKYGKSRSYIHRRLKELTNESVSQFIGRIRLEKAVELLKRGELTVSEVAYDVGFGSPSYFIKCFHERYGCSPGDFLRNNNESETAESIWELNIGLGIKKTKKKLLFGIVGISITLVAILLGGYFLGKANRHELEKSIAVLPLKYNGNDQETQILADGIMEDILNRLSHIEGLQVKSRMTSEKYSQPNMTMSQIGREMGVSYVLEGTIMREKGNVRIYIQLIEAETDKHLWAEQYDRDLTGIFAFVSNVSMQIADELRIILSPTEIRQLEKVYTANTEAYRLYQKGRFFWHRRTKEDLEKSVSYFTEALILDSAYALAFAGLADACFIQAWWGWIPWEEGFAKSKMYLMKALEIDNNLAEAHATLGAVLSWYEYDWKNCENEIKSAIQLNPNYATSYQYYSEYLDIINKRKEAREYIDRALEINPYSVVFYVLSSRYYYHDEDFERALLEGEKVLEIEPDFVAQHWINFRIYLQQKEDMKAIESLYKIIKLYNTETVSQKDTLLHTYSESGIKGIVDWAANWGLRQGNPKYYTIASIYSITGNRDAAVSVLEKAFTEGHGSLPRINCNPDFNILQDEPGFKTLLKKMNLSSD